MSSCGSIFFCCDVYLSAKLVGSDVADWLLVNFYRFSMATAKGRPYFLQCGFGRVVAFNHAK